MSSIFVMNQHTHYFEVTGSVFVDRSELVGCTIFDTESELVAAVVEATGLTTEEVEGHTFYIHVDDNDDTMQVCDRGFSVKLEASIEEHLSHFEM